jgi:putative polyketide hydroxylase
MGYIYHSAAVIPDDPQDGKVHESPRESKGRPGTRAPHVWINRGGQQISTLDLFGRNFALLASAEGSAVCESARAAAEQVKIDLDIHHVGADGLADPYGGFGAAYGIAPAGAVLVRPDGFVAWRSKTGDGGSTREIASAFTTVLCRESA